MSVIKVNKITSVNGSDSVEVDTHLKLKEQSATPTSTSHGALYVDTAGALKYQNGAVNEGSPVTISTTGLSLDSANTFTRGQLIDGSQNEVQLKVQGFSSQTTNPFEVTTYNDTDLFTVSNAGDVAITNNLTLNTDSSVFNMGADNDFSITHNGTAGVTIAGSPVNISSTNSATTFSSVNSTLTLNGGTGVYLQEDGTTVISIDNSKNVVIGNTTSAETIRIGYSTSETTVGDNLTVLGNLQVDGILDDTKLQSYSETICTTGAGISQSSNTITMDMSSGNVFYFARIANCTTIAFTNMVAGQSATWISKGGGSTFTNTFANISVNGSTLSGSNKLFPGGEPPGASTGANEVDIFTFFWDGTNLYTMTGGLNFS